jgi:hypothetical protein
MIALVGIRTGCIIAGSQFSDLLAYDYRNAA